MEHREAGGLMLAVASAVVRERDPVPELGQIPKLELYGTFR